MSRLIKKYKNRRLYDMESSQYITIDTLHQYVLQGQPFHVEDANTGKDITTTVLLQIIVEHEEIPAQLLSPELLKQMIIFADHPLNQTMKKLMEQFFLNMEQMLKTNADPFNLQKSGEQWQEWMKQLQNLYQK